ncbi:hypothetical protein LJ656_19490 [Paraburkholderia sp. MMS20-SJTR3]|uniref:Rap1a immunity protein domain-containing protein n=1 Tax=Paraburkholderia sejongensis TaxID=2886946 RepID=A0ABS8JY11_9BURK|nr:hypothetical protein [Paraburkholderia sp. MMS20-SJTR3]MCC8394780.1 hypothetical protein [Paraburkholderia sp. MMS20-SJTR3]
MKKTLIALILAGASIGTPAQQANPYAPVTIHNGFMTGNKYRELPDLMRRAYVMGVIDGLFDAPGIAFHDLSGAERLAHCIQNMAATDEQMTVIVDRYLDKNPTLWGQSMNTTAMYAVYDACRTAGTPVVPPHE